MKKTVHLKPMQVMLPVLFFGLSGFAQTFTKITTGPVVTSPGDSRSVNWVDVNNDGRLDLFISNGKAGGQNNSLFLNTDGSNFTAVVGQPLVNDNKPSDGATFADCDNDGDLDAFVVNWYNENNMFYLNNGGGGFEQQTTQPMIASGGYSETAAWGDYDNDGKLDLYVTRSGPSTATRRNQLYHNDGNNTFTKILTGDVVINAFLSRSVNWTDMDNDGDLDLFVTNEGTANNNENIYRNEGNGVFVRITAGDIVNNGGLTMSSSWGDYDNDGDLDVYLCNSESDNALFRNDGNFNFTKITGDPVVTTNSFSFSSAWSDIDNDGDLDLFVTNAFAPVIEPLHNFLFSNNGNGTFTKIENGWVATDLAWSYGCAFGDYDNDGFQDLAVATTALGGVDASDLLYHNDGNDNNWISIQLIGTATNKSAIGAKVRLTATINGNPVTQMREISAQSSYCGQNDLRAHFGLGDAAVINSITVDWPSATPDQVFTNISTNQLLTVTEGQGLKVGEFQKKEGQFIIYPNPANDILNIKAKDATQIASVKIYTAAGQLAMAVNDSNKTSAIDVSGLASGNYMLDIDSASGRYNTQFAKE